MLLNSLFIESERNKKEFNYEEGDRYSNNENASGWDDVRNKEKTRPKKPAFTSEAAVLEAVEHESKKRTSINNQSRRNPGLLNAAREEPENIDYAEVGINHGFDRFEIKESANSFNVNLPVQKSNTFKSTVNSTVTKPVSGSFSNTFGNNKPNYPTQGQSFKAESNFGNFTDFSFDDFGKKENGGGNLSNFGNNNKGNFQFEESKVNSIKNQPKPKEVNLLDINDDDLAFKGDSGIIDKNQKVI